MINSKIGSHSLIESLNSYLDSTRLSLGQIAARLDVSKGHLSEIKNGKKEPALDLGLRILKLCGMNADERRAWAHYYNQKISSEYLEVHEVLEGKENVQNLNENTSCLLSRDMDLMNAYLDIVNAENLGRSRVYLKEEYGRSIFRKLDQLVKDGALKKNEVAYFTGVCSPVVTKNASYELMRRVLDNQQDKFNSGQLDGKFQFDIQDLSNEGHQKLNTLFEETMKKAALIVEDNQCKKDDGGKRFIFQMLVGKLSLVLLFLGLSLGVFAPQTSYAHLGLQPVTPVLDNDELNAQSRRYFTFDSQLEDEIRETVNDLADKKISTDGGETNGNGDGEKKVEEGENGDGEKNTGGLGGGSSSRSERIEQFREGLREEEFRQKTWEEIKRDRGLYIDWARVNIQGSDQKVNNLCIEGNDIRTIEMTEGCLEITIIRKDCKRINEETKKGEDCRELKPDEKVEHFSVDEQRCTKKGLRHFRTPIMRFRRMCRPEGGCVDVKMNKWEKPTSHDVKIFFNPEMAWDSMSVELLATKKYHIPLCKK